MKRMQTDVNTGWIRLKIKGEDELNTGTNQGLVQKLLVLYVVIWSISPPLEIDLIYRLLALGSVGLWGIIAIRRGLYIGRIHIYAVLFAAAVVLIAYLEKESLDGILQQIAIYILAVCFIINCFYKERWEELRGIVPIVLLLLIYFNWKTGSILLEDPTIARRLVRADESTYVYLRQGIGGYSLIYPQVCIAPAMTAWVLSAYRKDKKYFMLGVIWMITYIRCIANAGYSLAIFTSIAGVVILFGFKGRSAVVALILSVLIFVVGLWAILYVDSFREFLLVQFDGTAVAKKIQDLVLSAQEGTTEGSIYDRMVAYKASVEVILEYPIIGSLWNRSGGGHSALMDVFAKYGIWGGIIYTKILFYVPKYYKETLDHQKMYAISNAVIVSIVFIAMLNSLTYSVGVMILLVLPLLYEDIIRWERIDG